MMNSICVGSGVIAGIPVLNNFLILIASFLRPDYFPCHFLNCLSISSDVNNSPALIWDCPFFIEFT